MNREQEEKLKAAAEKECYAQLKNHLTDQLGVCGQAVAGQVRRATPKEEAERDFQYHNEQAARRGRAAKFLELHPEFSQFIELIREGAIGI